MDRVAVRRSLFAIFVLAVLFRWALFHSGLVDVVFNTADSWQYDQLGRSILKGTFAENGVVSMNRTPGFPAFLALIYFLFGTSQLAVTAVHVVIDSLACVMIVHLAILMRLRLSALLLVSAMVITCPFTSVYTFELMSECVYTFALVAGAWVLFSGNAAEADPFYGTTRVRSAVAGLLFGFAVLARPAMGPALACFAAFIAVAALLKSGRRALEPLRLAIPALFVLAIVGLVLPWMVRNYVVFHAEYEKHDENVSLLGFKAGIPTHRHLYTKKFGHFLASYEEPLVLPNAYVAPEVARYVYPGEKEEVASAFARLAEDIKKTGTYDPSSLSAFDEIAQKRYRAAPRLYVTAPVSKILKIWISPRIAVLFEHRSGANSSRAFSVFMTLYGSLYVMPGMLGIWWGLRQRNRHLALFVASMVIGHTFVYAFFMRVAQSRYSVPFFPLFALAGGALLDHLLRRRRAAQS